jgi:hypothetical protein
MFTVYNPDIESSYDELLEGGFTEQEHNQHFAWFPGLINFYPFGASGKYWIEVHKSDSYRLEENINFALSLPFTVSKMNAIQIIGTDDLNAQTVPIARGKYQLVYQDRYLTQSEIDEIPDNLGSVDPEPDPWINLGPKSCKLTLVKTSTEVAAKILKVPEGLFINLPLELRK